MANKYSFQGYNEEHMARGLGVGLSISTKQSIEICNRIRGMNVQKAKKMLQEAIDMKRPIEFKKFTNGLGHKKGKMGSGRYPVKCSQSILKLLESVEANAGYKGLNASSLVVKHASANLASRPMRYGRQIRRQMKSTHVEIVLEEKEAAPKESKKKTAKKEEKKTEVKKPAAEEKKLEAKKPEVKDVKKEEPKKVEEKKPEVKKTEEKKEAPKSKEEKNEGKAVEAIKE